MISFFLVKSGRDISPPASFSTAQWAGSPRWRSSPGSTAAAGDGVSAESLLEGYRRWGGNLPVHLTGSYSVAIVDPADGSMLVATDRFGRHPVFYAIADKRLIASSTLGQLVDALPHKPTLLPQALLDYVYFHMIPAPRTVFEGCFKLPPASVALFRDGQLRVCPHWQPEFSERAEPVENLASDLRRALADCMQERLAEGQPVGCYLSGGLDSSTVVGLAAQAMPGRTHSFTIGFNVPGYDEMRYARIAAQKFGAIAHEYYLTPLDVVDALPLMATAFDEPFGNSSALPAYFCARMARDAGFSALLAGDGGDELFAGNERYRTQLVFEMYDLLPTALRHFAIEPAVGTLRRLGIALGKKGHSYVSQAKIRLPGRLQSYNFLERHNVEEVFASDLIERVDRHAPQSAWRERYDEVDPASALNRMLYLDWKFTLADNDLVKVCRSAQLAGIDVEFPLLDDEIVELSCRVPSYMKIRNFQLRWFYKRAMKGFLPDEILAKSKHGFGLPFGVWTRNEAALRRIIDDALSSLLGRGLFRADFLDRTVRMHRDVHASYYGELIWILSVLELWLREHAPDWRL